MANDDKKNGVAGQILVAVAVALLAGGTSPWWWREFIGTKAPPEIKNITPNPSTPTPTATPSTSVSPDPPPERASINVAYTGDNFGCSLPLSIMIGDREFYPKGNLFQASDIQLGQQKYRVKGQIYCPTIGNCQVNGEGFVSIIPGNTYNVAWQNTGVGQCAGSLQ